MSIKHKKSDIFCNGKFNFKKHYDIIKSKKFFFNEKYDYFVRFHQDLREFSRLKLYKNPKNKKIIPHNNASELCNELLKMYLDEYVNFLFSKKC